jgi:hypothetical protein
MYSYIAAYTDTRLPVLAERVLGFAWVGHFLVWSTPMYRPAAGLNDSIVPFSIIGLLS